MDITEQRIRAYAAAHRRLPASLSDLPKLEQDRDSELADGWERPIHYRASGQTVTLLSLGKDARPGGTGQDSDIEATFTVLEAPSQPATQR